MKNLNKPTLNLKMPSFKSIKTKDAKSDETLVDKETKSTIESLLPFEDFYNDILNLERKKLTGSCSAAFSISSMEIENLPEDFITNLLSDFETLLDRSFYITQICQYNFRATEKNYLENKRNTLENTNSEIIYNWMKSDYEFEKTILDEHFSFESNYYIIMRYDYLPTSNLVEDMKRAKRKFDLFCSASNNLFKKHNISVTQLNWIKYSELIYYVLNPNMKGRQTPNFESLLVKGNFEAKRPVSKNKIFVDLNEDEESLSLEEVNESTELRKSIFTLKNRMVPYAIKKLDDCLMVGDVFQVTYEVYDLPPNIKTFWQKELALHVGNIDIAYFFKALKTDEVVKELGRISSYSRASLTDSKGNDLTYKSSVRHMKKQSDNIMTTLDEISDGQRLFNFSMVIRVRANSYEELLAECEDVENILGSTLCNFRKTVDNYISGLVSILPMATNQLKTTLPMLTQGVGNTFPMINHSFTVPNGEIFGINKSNQTLMKYTNDSPLFDNNMVVVLGKSGSGKSVTSKKIVKNNAVYRGHRVFGIDPDNECIPFCNELNGTYINVYSGSPIRINMFDPIDDPEIDSLIQPTVNNTTKIIVAALRLNDDDAFNVKYMINVMMREAGFTDDKKSLYVYSDEAGDSFSLDRDNFKSRRKAPTMSDLYRLAKSNTLLNEIGDTSRLASKISLLTEGGTFPLFDGQTNVDVSNKYVFFGFKRCEEEYKEVAITVAYSYFWKYKFLHKDVECTVYNEEASVSLRTDSLAEIIYDIAIRIRKHKGFPIFTTQNISMLLKSIWGEAILTNSSCCFFMKQGRKDADSIVENIEALKPAHITKMVQMDKGECIAVFNELTVVNLQIIVSDHELDVFKTSEIEKKEEDE